MRRREFITLIGGAAAAWPLAARAQQQQRVRRIGVLMGILDSDRQAKPEVAAFESSLRHLGWIPGSNVQIDYRWPGGNTALAETFAEELITLRPDVFLSRTTPATAALKKATHDIPIVFVVVVEPIASGFVESLARPGGNITGFTNFEASLAGKWLNLLKEVSPSIAHVAFLYNPSTAPFAKVLLEVAAAHAHAVRMSVTAVQDIAALEHAISALAHQPNGGLVAMPDSFIVDHRKVIIGLAARHRLPAIYPNPICTLDGGLMSYSVNYPDQFHRAAGYINRILNGAKPADLPVQQPTKFELFLNLRTAKSLGLTVPQMLLATADEVIE